MKTMVGAGGLVGIGRGDGGKSDGGGTTTGDGRHSEHSVNHTSRILPESVNHLEFYFSLSAERRLPGQ
ncbi:hypothetical protein L829_1256 [Mycobacteroides abscessus MAB_030201_1075]|uniref:Uncharacterized protein n=1 Tax=Mycobacteroides abscessus MAB_030201_1075 TaxID=1335410 RepID=A0A829PLB7_9MYCO|nr:hypothetical protein MA6G0125R_4800 [Mycobacteroides abscessus 6G-0125-R]EIU50299.1 hypothetical protein MA6G0125S_0535 [Mycobacteroides abscessus 6G-0125-S]EIU61164.1 hypothetical protein MA6G0728S_0168 [Mycobacteroides abscessus 6G-0728-S]EIU66732.1 hypothetical protein MA6G1108_0524 [Mycobacteroides abscessus 6G-1108]EIU99311.1 hypothetical protein MA6G0212_0595 [Mycobacteroides abscessus 6G-0212]EIV02533.1 hypothetical protein MA6G0728R_0528 [Mycobacteroides abscessus 6G-0728-R]EIV3015